MTRNGVLYVAFGKKYVDEAVFSAKTLKDPNDIHVTMFSDIGFESRYIDSVVKIYPQSTKEQRSILSHNRYITILFMLIATQELFEIY